MTVVIRRVEAEVVRPLRHEVLRPGADLAESVYPVDGLAVTVHLAAVADDEVVGTATVFPEPYEGCPAWRLRGMAVAESYRGRGAGSQLLSEVVRVVRANRADLLWCNARTVALPFYTGRGFTIVGKEFLAAHGVPHYLAVLRMDQGQG